MTEDELPGSLAAQAAAWIPPWQRASLTGESPEETDESPEDSDEQADEAVVETEPASVAVSAGPAEAVISDHRDTDADDIDADDIDANDADANDVAADATRAGDGWQQPETDRLVEVAPTEPGGDDDDDWQQPETDRAFDFDAAEPSDSDSAHDWQPPETNRAVEITGSEPGDDTGDDADDDWQQPETDRLTAPDGGASEVGRTPSIVETPAAADRPENLPAALEAILLVVDEPVSADVLAEVLAVSVAEAGAALVALSAQYTDEGRGFDLRRAAGGWRLYTRDDYARYVEGFVLGGQSVRLTQAALETLAVIAYQQPVTRSRMSAIRGVNCDGVVRTLANRGLIEECGTQADSGAFLYRTTPLFLEKLGLDSVDELPPLAPFLPDDVNGFVDA